MLRISIICFSLFLSMAAKLRQIGWESVGKLAGEMIPLLSPNTYKGQNGKIAILGGSFEYTGAPYYAAQSALRFGADLAYVFCAKEAAIPIKSYSPELMVVPFYESETVLKNEATISAMATAVIEYFSRLHVLVVGPGLGRKVEVKLATLRIIDAAAKYGIPMVIDADGLWVLSQDLRILRQCKSCCVITPNAAEFERLVEAVRSAALAADSKLEESDSGAVSAYSSDAVAIEGTGRLLPLVEAKRQEETGDAKMDSKSDDSSYYEGSLDRMLLQLESQDEGIRVNTVARFLGRAVCVVRKGREDLIACGSSGNSAFSVSEPGGLKRSGGQGDILAGNIAVALHWATKASFKLPSMCDLCAHLDALDVLAVQAEVSSSSVPSKAPSTAFTTEDMIAELSALQLSSSNSQEIQVTLQQHQQQEFGHTDDTAAAATPGLQEFGHTDDTAAAATPGLWASVLAACVTRRASSLAYSAKARSMTAPDVIEAVGEAFQEITKAL